MKPIAARRAAAVTSNLFMVRPPEVVECGTQQHRGSTQPCQGSRCTQAPGAVELLDRTWSRGVLDASAGYDQSPVFCSESKSSTKCCSAGRADPSSRLTVARNASGAMP